jgi:hypothetical protein
MARNRPSIVQDAPARLSARVGRSNVSTPRNGPWELGQIVARKACNIFKSYAKVPSTRHNQEL